MQLPLANSEPPSKSVKALGGVPLRVPTEGCLGDCLPHQGAVA